MAVITKKKQTKRSFFLPTSPLCSVACAVVFIVLFNPSSGLGASRHMSNNMSLRNMWESQMHIVYGTAWKKEQTAQLVEEAVTTGFRFIDTACQPKHYNEAGVGEGWYRAALKLGIDRSDMYLQTKFTPIDGQDPNRIPYDKQATLTEQVQQSLSVSLKNLNTEYLDALVLHSPLRRFEDTLIVWRQFEKFVDEGKVKVIGISNCYDLRTLQALYEEARHKPKVLQNRFYAESAFDTGIRQFCKEKGILYQSFWTLTANRHALATPDVKAIAATKQLTPQTLMYAFMMTLGHTPLSGTTNKEHMAEDVAIMERVVGGEQIFADDQEIAKFAEILGIPGHTSSLAD